MRILFLLVLTAGLAMGIGYPFAVSNFSGTEIGRFTAYDRERGYRLVEVELKPEHAPLRVLVDMASVGSVTLDGASTLLTLTATVGGRTVLARTLTFAHQQPRSDNPQAGGIVYRDDAGVIDPVEGGRYVFELGPGDAEGIQMRSAEIVLRSATMAFDPRALPIGYSLMAIGFIGLLLSFKGRQPKTPAAPPPPKWGR